jgi:hypothetical protein
MHCERPNLASPTPSTRRNRSGHEIEASARPVVQKRPAGSPEEDARGAGRDGERGGPRLGKDALFPRSDRILGMGIIPGILAGLFHPIARSRAASGRDRAAGSDLVARGRE